MQVEERHVASLLQSLNEVSSAHFVVIPKYPLLLMRMMVRIAAPSTDTPAIAKRTAMAVLVMMIGAISPGVEAEGTIKEVIPSDLEGNAMSDSEGEQVVISNEKF